ncbi:MAG: Hpt domain-containing protein [Deltaproteobacteria bacterium]|jgi:chemotaxis protein histidine kinase CheA|nr:Hpt domain-containing protein [Deltaproteobacteria bacterium]
MSSDLLEEFIFDSREHLSNASSQLLALEKNPGSLESLNSLMGTLHTIKGNSGFVNQRHLYELLHAAESLLQTVRDTADRKCPPNVVEALFQVLDTAEAIMGRLENDEDDDVDWLPNLLDALNEAQASLEWGVGQEAAVHPGDSYLQGEAATNPTALPTTQAPSAPLAPSTTAAPLALPTPPAATGQTALPTPPTPPMDPPKESQYQSFDPSSAVQKIVLENGELLDKGENYLEESQKLAGHNPLGLILDMRHMTSFTTPEVRLLERLYNFWGQKLKILLSTDEQSDFYLMFAVLDMQKPYSFFPEESEALEALKAGN